ncbi:MAG: hypothetical protein WAL45_12880 [Terracidiphilus sp.]
MAKKAKTDLAVKSAVSATIDIDARIAAGMFFALTGTILAAFGLSTRAQMDVYAKSLGIDANLWWGLALLIFGILMLAFGRRGQIKLDKAGR